MLHQCLCLPETARRNSDIQKQIAHGEPANIFSKRGIRNWRVIGEVHLATL